MAGSVARPREEPVTTVPALLKYHSLTGKLALSAAVLGSGLAFLDSAVVNVALPAIGRDFDVGLAEFQWVVNSYLVTLGALVLLGGSLGDLWGKRRTFVIGVTWFAAASVACGGAPTIEFLFAARAVQGVGAALLIPSSLAVVQQCFVPEDRGEAIGLWSGLSGISIILGPFLGGWLVDVASWRLIFLVNPPLAALAIWMTLRYVPDHPPRTPVPKPDWPGGVAATLGLAGVVFALIQGPVWGWTDGFVLATGVTGVVLLAIFGAIEARVADPMLPLDIFRIRQFTGANLATLPVYGALSGVFFLFIIQLQNNLGYSALEAGAAAIPTTALLLLLSPRAGRLYNTIGPRLPMSLGPMIGGIGIALLTQVEPGASYLTGMLPGLLVFGLGLALTVAPLTATVLGAVSDDQAGLASGVSNAVARIAGLLAIPLIPLAAGLSSLSEVEGPGFSAGFSRAMWIGAGVMVLGGMISWLLIRNPERQAG